MSTHLAEFIPTMVGSGKVQSAFGTWSACPDFGEDFWYYIRRQGGGDQGGEGGGKCSFTFLYPNTRENQESTDLSSAEHARSM